jgi:hypothetical protein
MVRNEGFYDPFRQLPRTFITDEARITRRHCAPQPAFLPSDPGKPGHPDRDQ